MPYELKPKTMYMMPTHFGPMSGPRQGPGGEMGAFSVDQRKTRAYAVSFLTEQAQLEALLPPGFEAVGEPVVTVTQTHMTEIDWLAGRGYSTLGVTFQARYNGSRDRATGPLLLVLWENLTDPILTGREQLGFSKIYCELPEPVIHGGETQCTSSWLEFRFMDMRLMNLVQVEAPAAAAAATPDDGVVAGDAALQVRAQNGGVGRSGRGVRSAESGESAGE